MSREIPVLYQNIIKGDDDVILLDFSLSENDVEEPYVGIEEDYDDVEIDFKIKSYSDTILSLKHSNDEIFFFENVMTAHIPAEFTKDLWHEITGFIKFTKGGITRTEILIKIYPATYKSEII